MIKVLCPNIYLDDYSKKGYVLSEDDTCVYVMDALTYEWWVYKDFESSLRVNVQKYAKQQYRLVKSEFVDVSKGNEWIFDYEINSKEEFIVAAFFFNCYLNRLKGTKQTPYDCYNHSLTKTKMAIDKKQIIINQTINSTYDVFFIKVYEFFIKTYSIRFYFKTHSV